MFKILDITKDNVIAFKASGKVQKTDYEILNPLLDKTEKEYDDVKLFILIEEIESITPEALMKDIVTYFKHIKYITRVAVVGEGKAEKSWAKVADPFIKGDIKYFPLTEYDIARDWIEK